MQVRIFSIFALSLFFPIIMQAQQNRSVIKIEESEFNFGTVREIDGIIHHDFRFTNEGKTPLIINDVRSSCGCTVAAWPHEPILPGKSGAISITFDPKNQTGAINKSIQVLSNADVPQFALTVKGVVIPAQKVEEVYKFTIGALRLQTIYAAFGEILKGKTAIYTIKVFNTSDTEPARLSFTKVPAHIRVSVTPEIIEPQQEGIISLEYLTPETTNWDYTVDKINFLINGKSVSNNRINVTARIKEDFSALTAEQLASAARVEFDSLQHDFGKISPDKIVEHSFKLTNTGKTILYIRKVSASCGCTAVQPVKTTILPGESTEIKAVFNARGREGKQKKAITVITNDPKHSKTILWINAVVDKPAISVP